MVQSVAIHFDFGFSINKPPWLSEIVYSRKGWERQNSIDFVKEGETISGSLESSQVFSPHPQFSNAALLL